MSSFYKQQLNDWVATLDVKADTVIDIGGSQNPIKGRTKSWESNNYLIYDLEQPHVELQKPDVIFDLQKYSTLKQKADLVFCLEVFDYIRDPMRAFSNISKLLKTNGEAWISFPFVYPIHNPVEDEGLRYTESAIRWYGEIFKMPVQEIIYRRPYPHNTYLDLFYRTDGMRAASGVDHFVTGYIVRFKK